MQIPCPVPSCTRTRPGHLSVCTACSAELLRDLADVPSLEHHLELAITRQTRIGGGTSPVRQGADEPADEDIALTIRRAPLPWDERARTAQHHLRATLVGWVRVLQHGAKPYRGPWCASCAHRSCLHLSLREDPDDTMASMAAWLIRHRARLLVWSTAPEAVDGICEAIRYGRRVIDRPADRIYAGPCNECGADLLAKPGLRYVVCQPCDLEYEVAGRQEWMMKQLEDQLAHSIAISGMLAHLGIAIPASTIRYFAQKGRILAHGQDAHGRPLYRVGDVLEVHRQRTVGGHE